MSLFRQRLCSVMQQPSVQLVTRAAGYLVVNGDVVLHQMLFVVLIVYVVAQMAIRVYQVDYAEGDPMSLGFLKQRPQSRYGFIL